MTTTTFIANFEHLTPRNDETAVPSPYKGLNWAHTIAGGDHSEGTSGEFNGYQAVLRGHAYGFNNFARPCTMSSASGINFSLKSGHFASAWNNGEHVKFTAFDNGVEVAHRVVILDQADTLLHFGHKFAHIDEITFVGHGGTQAGEGSGRQIAFDNLKIVFDGDVADGAHGPQPRADDHSGPVHVVDHDLTHDFMLSHGVADTWLL